jgi:hypothetical protein
MRGDLEAVGLHRETEALADLGFDLLELLTFKLDDFVAVLANDVIVVGMFCVIGIVKFIVFPKIHFPNQAALG